MSMAAVELNSVNAIKVRQRAQASAQVVATSEAINQMPNWVDNSLQDSSKVNLGG